MATSSLLPPASLPHPRLGQLYTSLGNRTEAGTLGSVTGGQGLTAEFEYVGNGQYRVKSSSGGTFTIQ